VSAGRPAARLRLILVVSVALNVAAALALGNGVRPLPGTHDQLSYDALAWRVASGQGFTVGQDSWPLTRAGQPTAHWSYLYTGYLALVYRLFGHVPLVARLIQALLVGLLLPWGLYRLASALGERRAGLWAAALGAAYVYFVYYSASLMSEMATIVAVVWLLEVVVRLVERPSWRLWLAFGLLVAVAALLRQVTLVAVPPLALWILWSRRQRATALGLAVAGVLAVALVLPVTVRNARAFGRFVPINTNAGFAFYWANHPVHGTRFQGILSDEGPGYVALIPVELRRLDEAALNDALMARGLGFVRSDPRRYVLLCLSRLEDYFMFWPSGRSSALSNVSRVLSFGLLLPLMLAGLWLSRLHWRRWMPLYLFAGSYVIVHLLSWALIRYRLPVDAVLLVFAGLAADPLANATRRWALLRRGEPLQVTQP
jgi:4-amino-4-deoxy-L-arabinose transferase-like glycosyltransferase